VPAGDLGRRERPSGVRRDPVVVVGRSAAAARSNALLCVCVQRAWAFRGLRARALAARAASRRRLWRRSGPAGLFAALRLAEAGERVVLLERGEPVERRGRAIGAMAARGVLLNPDSNFCYGARSGPRRAAPSSARDARTRPPRRPMPCSRSESRPAPVAPAPRTWV